MAIQTSASARTWRVGPTETYKRPSEVMTLVGDGDTVIVTPGLYVGDVGVWTRNDLHIFGGWGSSPYAHLDAGGNAAQKKAIWVITGKNVQIEGFEFSGCTVPDRNGAGIRQEGRGLTVRHCYFHDNEDGILTGADTASHILIEFSEFARNGYGDGYSHNMYIGHIASFTLRCSYMHGAKSGHQVKSRADSTWIDCNFITDDAPGDPPGTSSFAVDVPNAGYTLITRNIIVKGSSAENRTLINYGEEGATNRSGVLSVSSNTLVSFRSPSICIQATGATSSDTAKVVLTDANIIAGFTTPYSIQQMAQRLFDTSSMDLSVFHFSDPARLDFHLMEPCSIVGHSASDPIYEYRHPMDSVERFRKGPIDFGAFSSRPAFSVLRASDEDGRLLVSSGKIMLNATEDTPHLVSCYDVLGRLVAKEELRSGQSLRIGPGAYLYTIEWQDRVDRGMIVVP